MRERQLGSQGLTVSEIGLGCMGMSFAYTGGGTDESTATIHRALDLGVTHLDTAHVRAVVQRAARRLRPRGSP